MDITSSDFAFYSFMTAAAFCLLLSHIRKSKKEMLLEELEKNGSVTVRHDLNHIKGESLKWVEAYTEEKPTPSPSAPAGYKVFMPKTDEETGEPVSSIKDNFALCTSWFLIYKDGSGQKSERRITLLDVLSGDYSDATYLKAYCHERRAPRNFRTDRIEEIVDLATGQVYDDPEKFMPLFEDIAGDADGQSRKDLIDTLKPCRYGIFYLVYLARVDGEYHPNEEEVIIDYVLHETKDSNINQNLLRRYVRRLYPDQDHFEKSLRQISRYSAKRREYLNGLAHKLLAADGNISADEKEAIEQVAA